VRFVGGWWKRGGCPQKRTGGLAKPEFRSQVQQGYANRICTSLPSSLRIAWKGVLKPRPLPQRRHQPEISKLRRQQLDLAHRTPVVPYSQGKRARKSRTSSSPLISRPSAFVGSLKPSFAVAPSLAPDGTGAIASTLPGSEGRTRT
jgi:hypothetical protein